MEIVHIDINNIKCYENNPRQIINPMFDEIKASIDANGLLSPFAITQRPGEHHYILYKGVNTG